MSLSPGNRRLLMRQFESLVAGLYPDGMSTEQREQALFMFFGGAVAYRKAAISAHGLTGMDMTVVPHLGEEIAAFVREGVERDRAEAACGTAH